MKKILCILIAALTGIQTLKAQQTAPPAPPVRSYLISTKGDTVYQHGADSIFSRVEIESEFPGGQTGWAKYLNDNLRYPAKAIRQRVQGTVDLVFVVCSDGTVCDVEAISGPDILRKAAVEAFRKTPNWKPAQQDNRKVKSYKKQPIVFRLQ